MSSSPTGQLTPSTPRSSPSPLESSQTPGRSVDVPPQPSLGNPAQAPVSLARLLPNQPASALVTHLPVAHPPKPEPPDQDVVQAQPFVPSSTGTYKNLDGLDIHTTLVHDASEMVVFDLSSPKFGPMQYYRDGERSTLGFLPVGELSQPATKPPTTALDIMCGRDFSWCIELRLVDTHRLVGRVPQPISVGDILVRIYQFMSQPMEGSDWSGITDERVRRIRETHKTRCNVLGGVRGQEEREKGPKKIDYFEGKVWFGGLQGLQADPRGPKDIKALKLTMLSGNDRLFLF